MSENKKDEGVVTRVSLNLPNARKLFAEAEKARQKGDERLYKVLHDWAERERASEEKERIEQLTEEIEIRQKEYDAYCEKGRIRLAVVVIAIIISLIACAIIRVG